MKAILQFEGYFKTLELESPPPIYTDEFTLSGEKVKLPFVKIGEEKVDGEMVTIYRAIEPKDFNLRKF